MDTPAGQMHVIYRWKSIYLFSPQLVKQLSNTIEVDSVKCEFDTVSQAFILDGERDEVTKALENLRRAVEKAADESRKYYNPGYGRLIQRARLSEFNATPIVWKEIVDDEAETSIKPAKNAEFRYTQDWSPVFGTDFASMLHPQDIEDDIPTMIERVCDCRIEKDTFNRQLRIRSDDPHVIARVIEKLTKIEDIFNTTHTSITTYLVYVEDQQDFELRLVSLKAQLKTNGKTTLFGEKNKRYYKDRSKIYTLRVLRRVDAAAKPVVVPLEIKKINGERDPNGPRAWRDYQFQGYGGFENDPTMYVRPSARAPLQQHHIPQAEFANNLSTALDRLLLDTNDDFELGPRPNFATQQDLESTDFLLGPRPNFGSTEEVPGNMPMASRRRVRGMDELNTQSPHTTEAAGGLSSTAPSAPPPNEDDLDDFLGPRPGPAPADDFNQLLAPRPAPHFNVTQSGVVRATRRLRVPDNMVPEESAQNSSEQGSRNLRNVNSQRAPRRDVFRRYDFPGHNKFNIQTMRDVFESGFDYARLHKSRITFEARIGRVIYDNAPPPTKCMNWDDLIPILDDRKQTMKAFFTDRVTSDPVDVDYICDLKLSADQNFFNYEPDKKTVWYEFMCDYKNKPCNIKFDAETGEMEVLGRLDNYGTAFWNCPLRSWDARFALQARKVLSSEEPVFRSLCESLFTPGGTGLPDISFRTESNQLMVKKVYCKREARYLVLPNSLTGPRRNFEFCVTEVQDLWMQAHTASDETFKAIATERPDMIANERLHYTFSLAPSKHREIFNAQTQLEIGEVPQWIGSTILEDGTLQAMVAIVNALIQRIDGVGYNNRGAWVDG